ncbi:MAG: glycosyltransferase family 4 protein [Lachnospiraceae bacterium]
MIGHKRIPSREGGIEIVVEELATRMVALGPDVTCYNRKGHHVSGQEFDTCQHNGTYKGVEIKWVFTIDKKGLAAMTSSFFAAVKAAFSKYDVVHFHAEGPCAMMWIPKMFGKRCVATIHGLDWARRKWGGFATKYIKFGEKVAIKCADEIIVLSKNVQQYFKDTYNRETVFIPNGVNKPEIREAREITEDFRLNKDSYILFLGRIVPEKGVHYLIEAFKNVYTDKKLVIAGGASDTDEYMNALKTLTNSDDRIIFTGFVQGRQLEELYSNAFIYTLPSDLEGMPLSLLEAMSYGNCVLGSDICEIAEVVEDKAVLFQKGNVSDLQEKLQWLLDNSDVVKEYKDTAIDFICDKYNWDNIVEETLKLYRLGRMNR